MPYSLNWYIPDEVIYLEYSGVVTVDELRESLLTQQSILDSSTRPLIHVIIDTSQVTQAVAPAESMKITRTIGNHPRSGWNLVIKESSPLIKLGVMLGTLLLKLRYRSFDTFDEAVEFLKDMYPTLNWELAKRPDNLA